MAMFGGVLEAGGDLGYDSTEPAAYADTTMGVELHGNASPFGEPGSIHRALLIEVAIALVVLGAVGGIVALF